MGIPENKPHNIKIPERILGNFWELTYINCRLTENETYALKKEEATYTLLLDNHVHKICC